MNFKYATQLGLSLITFFILFSTYKYLDNLDSCACFIENQHPKYKVNIEFLKFYQVLEIVALFVFLCFLSMYKNKLFGGGKQNIGMRLFVLLTTLLLLFISGYVSVYSILLYMISKKDCVCVNQWQKYIVYIQGTFNTIYFLRLAYIFLFVLLILAFNKK